MRRKLALVLTVIAGLSLAGCSAKPGNETTAEVKTQGETTVGESAEKAQESSEKSGETKGETVKLTWWMEMSTPELNEAYEAAAAAYMEKNPNIEIEFREILRTPRQSWIWRLPQILRRISLSVPCRNLLPEETYFHWMAIMKNLSFMEK